VPAAPDGPADIALSVRDLHTHFHTDSGVVKAVDGVSFDVKRGEVLAVVGESGSGKSVTGLSIMRLLAEPQGRIDAGEIWWRGDDLVQASEKRMRRVRGGEISMVFQDPMTALNPVFTVGAQIVEMIRLHEDVSKKEATTRAIDALSAVGIPQAAKRVKNFPHEFSGGMRQRAMIAMAIACDPDFIIADEPTTALDVTVQSQVLEVLAEARERTGASMIMITHDLGVVAGVADRVMVMYAGRQAEFGSTDDVYYDIRHPYTRGLLASLPRADEGSGETQLRPITGQPPSLLNPPSGCAFNPRCDQAEVPGRCNTEQPVLREVAPGHLASCHFADDPVPVAPGARRELAMDGEAIDPADPPLFVDDDQPLPLPPTSPSTAASAPEPEDTP
jgi:oligopeptide/dipeptide ABC transporter ATP-binding protein